MKRLLAGPVPGLIIDVSPWHAPDDRQSSLRYLSYFLEDGGVYIVANGEGERERDGVEFLVRQIEEIRALPDVEREAVREPDRALASILEVVERSNGSVGLRKVGVQFAKLRDWEATDILNENYGSDWGVAQVADEPFVFVSRARVVNHGDGPHVPSARELAVPALNVREYRHVTATARQILTYDRYVLPDSWRHPHQRRLNNRQLVHATAYHGYYKPNTIPTSSRTLTGAYYYLDTELPAHFGHITTDVISRMWGWDQARAQFPGVRALVSSKDETARVPSWQAEIFDAYGIPSAEVEIIGPRERVQVETLVGVSPLFENPAYVHPRIADDWARIARGLPHVSAPLDTNRIFVARPKTGKRECREHDAVEAMAVAEGLELFYPERYTFAEQAAQFSQCSVIAGWGGSGMFSMMFAPQARIVLISSDAYTARNEELFAAVLGQEIHYFWGASEVAHPPKGWSLAAFTAPWRFDVATMRDEFAAVVAA